MIRCCTKTGVRRVVRRYLKQQDVEDGTDAKVLANEIPDK